MVMRFDVFKALRNGNNKCLEKMNRICIFVGTQIPATNRVYEIDHIHWMKLTWIFESKWNLNNVTKEVFFTD